MQAGILSLRKHQEHLASLIYTQDQTLYSSLKHSQLEGAFKNRVFVVFKGNGKTEGAYSTPTILGRLKVLAFEVNDEVGCEVLIKNMDTGEERWIGHVPERLWGYRVFAQIPPNVELHWSARGGEREVSHTLVFGMVFRMADHPESVTPGQTYILSPKKFKNLFPNHEVDLH